MYGEFEISLGQVNRISTDCESICQKIKGVPENLNQIKNALSGDSYASVRSVLETIAGEIKNQAALVQTMKDTLLDCAKEYQNSEKRIVQGTVSYEESNTTSGDGVAEGTEEEKDGFPWNKVISALWSAAGGMGTLESSVVPYLRILLSGVTGETVDAGKIAKAMKAPVDFFAAAFEIAGNDKGMREGLMKSLGLRSYLAEGTEAGASFWSYFKQGMGSNFKGYVDTSTAAKTAKAVSKWAGVIVTGITQGVDNYGEYQEGGISAERAVAETVLESGVDIAMGAAATAAVGAGLAAAGVVGAPVILVGALGGAAVVGVNALAEYITGKDVGENFSDFVCDTAGAIADGAGAVADWFGSLWD